MAKAKSTCVAGLHLVAAVLVVITTLAAAVASAPPPPPPPVPVLDESFDVKQSTESEQYASFLAHLDLHVASTASRKIKNNPVLGRQQLDRAPPLWLRVHLTGGSGGGRATLMIRSDNLYLCGFCNDARCFAFHGDDHKIPGSAPLSFGSTYKNLFGDAVGYRGLDSLLVSQKEAARHLGTLASFRGGADDHLKEPLAFFILTVCESERFVPIRKRVKELWKNGGHINDLRKTSLVLNWREISCAILAWDRKGKRGWDRNEEARNIKSLFGIKDAADALSRVWPILQTTKCSRT